MTLTLSAKPATTLFISNRGSVRRVSGFVLVGYSALCRIFAPVFAPREIKTLALAPPGADESRNSDQ
jgi:hypothetical protein